MMLVHSLDHEEGGGRFSFSSFCSSAAGTSSTSIGSSSLSSSTSGAMVTMVLRRNWRSSSVTCNRPTCSAVAG